MLDRVSAARCHFVTAARAHVAGRETNERLVTGGGFKRATNSYAAYEADKII